MLPKQAQILILQQIDVNLGIDKTIFFVTFSSFRLFLRPVQPFNAAIVDSLESWIADCSSSEIGRFESDVNVVCFEPRCAALSSIASSLDFA